MQTNRNDSFDKLIASTIDDLTRHTRDNQIHPNYLPSKSVVIEITEIIRNLIFPGYFDLLNTESPNIEHHIGVLVIEAAMKLEEQICRSLLHDNLVVAGACGGDAELRSKRITEEFIAKIPALRDILFTDVEATLDGDPAARNRHEIIFAYPGIYAISVYRMAHELYLLGVPLIPRIMTEHAHSITGIDINPGAEIGHHFFIDHGTGVVIGETTKIGNYVKIYQGVTLGALSTRGGQSLRGKKRHPTIEDEVTIYSSTSILGGETVIGSGAVIGSNTFITMSIAPGTRVSMKTPELNFKAPKDRNSEK